MMQTAHALSRSTFAATLAIVALVSCRSSGPPIPEDYVDRSPRLGGHVGPAVDPAGTGTGRFAGPLLEAFDVERAMEVAQFADGLYRAPASDGYEATIERLLADLYGAGFGSNEGFELDVESRGMAQPAWTPVSAKLIVQAKQAVREARKEKRNPNLIEQTLIGFDEPTAVERAMLPIGTPSCDVSGRAVFALEDIEPGTIFVTDQRIRSVEQDAAQRGAAAIVSSFLLPYCVDPTGRDQHYDAIFQDTLRPGSTLPSFYVSPRTAQNMRIATEANAEFRMVAEVDQEVRELRTIFATVRGSKFPDECVYVLAHADGAGANDNASGVGAVLQLALSIKRLVDSGEIERPRRSIRFVFGQESSAGSVALDLEDDTPIAAIVADMIGASYEATGAVCLLERGWDPGALITLPPDSHTPWGAGAVVEEDIVPNGLAIVLRSALVDVGLATRVKGKAPWSTREHPWEGGADHDAFLARGYAAALVWHFTDFTYQTSLDRMANVDPAELRRTTAAIGAAALAVADASPLDLERHLDTLNLERRVRLEAVTEAGAGVGLEELWKDWFDGARFWLKALTAGEPLPEPEGLRALDSFGSDV